MASSHSRYKGIAHVTVKLWNALVLLLPVPKDQMVRCVVKEECAKMEFVHVTNPTSRIQELIILLFLVQAVNVTISFVTMDLKDLFVEEMEFVNVLMEHTVVPVYTITTITGQETEGTACQCNSDYCVDPFDSCHNLSNVKCPVCSSHGICKPCSSQLVACECHSGFYGRYCQHQYKPQCTADENCIQCYSRADNSATDCQKCTGYLSLDQPQLDGYQVMSSIPNTTVS